MGQSDLWRDHRAVRPMERPWGSQTYGETVGQSDLWTGMVGSEMYGQVWWSVRCMDRYGGQSDVWTGMVVSQMYGQVWWAVRCMDRYGGQ